ncbi:hypothetical protein EW145_g4551 [Phellinidium pouzarii]|uniref:Methyltransferase type 11 domain-containing protein n=1 Tax=Phellinidium pouzarii TaxID=167371 RepID=A0A4S4L334_9AGAM|nr:hypothetical protein EW145_g4551 [Phellinidium pouzarii]
MASLPPPASGKVNPISAAGFGTGKSDLYNKARPGYAPQVLSHIRKAVSKKEGLNIVEIGCGSGIFTRNLLAHPEWSTSIGELKCIDPNEGMRAVFADTVKDPRVSLYDGTFDSTGVPDGWADVILSASPLLKAFHWCSDLEGALSEFTRILKRDGTISFLWNPLDMNIAWVSQIFEVCRRYLPPTYNEKTLTEWRRIFDLPLYKDSFTGPEEAIVPSAETNTLEALTLFVFTGSVVALLPDDEKEKIRREIKEIVQRGNGLVWVDKEKGMFEMAFAAQVVVMHRKTLH